MTPGVSREVGTAVRHVGPLRVSAPRRHRRDRRRHTCTAIFELDDSEMAEFENASGSGSTAKPDLLRRNRTHAGSAVDCRTLGHHRLSAGAHRHLPPAGRKDPAADVRENFTAAERAEVPTIGEQSADATELLVELGLGAEHGSPW